MAKPDGPRYSLFNVEPQLVCDAARRLADDVETIAGGVADDVKDYDAWSIRCRAGTPKYCDCAFY